MQVVVKKPRIDIEVTGIGLEAFAEAIRKSLPDATIVDDDPQDIEKWDYFQEMKSRITPAKILKIRRENAELSQSALAERCGIAASNIAQMETGKRAIGVKSAQKLASALDCKASDFVID
ncbi:MAG: helix-turn-helix transcriptional regulator [Lachnospiraceae bacterium]|nr:helix-turn-helix transcriptional regulator [Lachnospiraceae bacterium]